MGSVFREQRADQAGQEIRKGECGGYQVTDGLETALVESVLLQLAEGSHARF